MNAWRGMIGRLRDAWLRLRSNRAGALAFDVALIVAVFLAVHAWQTRDLPIDQAAPATLLPVLGGGRLQEATVAGQAGVVYFFAPWCRVCRLSIGNLDQLVDSGRVGWGAVVALDYRDAAEVAEFIEATGVDMPVLMGDPRTAADWSIAAFPTYYVIDAEGRIHSRAVGYSTWLGLWLRTLRAEL